MDNLEIKIIRFSSQNDDTLGLLMLGPKFECFTLEDEFRSVKKFGETRISAGRYKIVLHKAGRLHQKYSRRFPMMHKGMLLFVDVPKFTGIMFHIGNREDETDGCPLVGDVSHSNVEENGQVTTSAHAYKRFYPKVADVLVEGKEVWCEVVDYA